MLLTTHPLLVQRSFQSRSTPLPTLWATPGVFHLQKVYRSCSVVYISVIS